MIISLAILICFLIVWLAWRDVRRNSEQFDKRSSSFMHISFDDVELSLNNLAKNAYSSIWEEPFFHYLYTLHIEYGAKFSLYMYLLDILYVIGDRYQKDLCNTSDWLKFGLHAKNSKSTYEKSDYMTGKNDWETFIELMKNLTGTVESVDRIPRLHCFAGNKDVLTGMKDAENGVLGFLCSDAVRESYFLKPEQNKFLFDSGGYFIDIDTRLLFKSTDFRMDWFKPDFVSQYDYHKPTEKTVYDELVNRYSSGNIMNWTALICFCHEWQIYDGTGLNKYKRWIEDACRFANDYNISFDYVQGRMFK